MAFAFVNLERWFSNLLPLIGEVMFFGECTWEGLDWPTYGDPEWKFPIDNLLISDYACNGVRIRLPFRDGVRQVGEVAVLRICLGDWAGQRLLLNIDSLLLSLVPVELGERLHTIFFSLSADWGLCGDGGLLPCGSRGGDVDSLMAWLLTSNFTFVFACNTEKIPWLFYIYIYKIIIYKLVSYNIQVYYINLARDKVMKGDKQIVCFFNTVPPRN